MEIDEEIQIEDNQFGPSVFSDGNLLILRKVIKLTKLPAWLNRLSHLFGDASAGKVRSADWITLITIFLPFAIVEMKKSPRSDFVDAWYHLAMLTELAMLYQTNEHIVQKYLYHVVSYRSNITNNQPDISPTPNHHMACHLAKQLRGYGPANFLAAWHFEQINGILQKAPLNKKLNQMDFSMLKHIGRASNLVVLMESPNIPALVSKLGPLFCQQKKLCSLLGDVGTFSGENLQVKNIKTFKTDMRIPPVLYERVISILNGQNPSSKISYVNKQHGDFGKKIVPVPTRAKTQAHIKNLGLTYSNRPSVGSSILEYKASSMGSAIGKETRHFGQIIRIFQLVLHEPTNQGMQHNLYPFLCIYPFEKLNPFDSPKNPYPKICPDLNINVFYSPPAFTNLDLIYRYCGLITPEGILFHAAAFEHEAALYDTKHPLLAVKELSRGRSGPFL